MKNLFYVLLFSIGFLRIFGHVVGSDRVAQIGFALGSSPLPLVFSNANGIEDFVNETELTYYAGDGKVKTLTVDRKFHEKVEGPLSRVCVYGVAILYSPRFPRTLWEPVLKHGVCNRGPLSNALGLSDPVDKYSISLKSKKPNDDKSWQFEMTCL